MDNSKYIGKMVKIKIDRPLGSIHPKYNLIYPVNYGYVPNTISGDGEEIDAYLLGVFEPKEEYYGKCIALIKRMDEDDDKLIIVPKGKDYTDKEIEALVEFQERFFNHKIIRHESMISDEMIELVKNINNLYYVELELIKNKVNEIIEKKINDLNYIEHVLDELLNLPIIEAEELYYSLCDYLKQINNDSYKFYKKEYKKMWN